MSNHFISTWLRIQTVDGDSERTTPSAAVVQVGLRRKQSNVFSLFYFFLETFSQSSSVRDGCLASTPRNNHPGLFPVNINKRGFEGQESI